MIKIAFIGCAHIHAPAFVNSLKNRENISVKAVWDHDADRAKQYAEKLSSNTAADPEVIWNDPEITAVVIASETNLHLELVQCAAAAKKHMFVEKPLGFSAAEAEKMADAVKKAGVIFQTGYFMRGNPYHLFLKQQIEKGSFGKITRVRHSNCHSGALGGWFDKDYRWMANPEIAGCGAFGDLGTHSLDILLWMLGMPEKVTGTVQTLNARYGADCDEYGEGTMLYSNGVIASIAAGWVDCMNPVVCEISGTQGHAVILNNQLYFQSELVPGSDISSPVDPAELPQPWVHAFDLYLNALEGKDAPLVSVQEAADRNKVMEKIYTAAKNNTWLAV